MELCSLLKEEHETPGRVAAILVAANGDPNKD